MSLVDLIKEKIKNKAPIPFADFMHMALYNPEFGYYNSNLKKLGSDGDFITAPELTPVFGYTLANQFKDILKTLHKPIIFEFGAGLGKLCVDVLTYLEKINLLPDEYHILEVSGYLKSEQQKLIKNKIPHLANRVKWLTKWPEEPFQGVVIANEVLDAMPVNRFIKDKEDLYEIYISVNKNGDLIEEVKPCGNQRLKEHVSDFIKEDLIAYKSEVNLFIDDWILKCHSMLSAGMVFILDYGFPAHEYYHLDRKDGTLMCHYKHQAHPNPLINIGEQDITAHVNFTHVANAAYNAGFHIAGYTNQAAFLLGNDILNIAEKEFSNDIKVKQALKILLQPNEMGELFKVIALAKNLDLELNGFKLNDKRVSL